MDAFRSAIDDCGMVDLGFKGNIFTWQRGINVDTMVKERLDRCMANNAWCAMFQFSEVLHFPIYKSDHARILLKFGRDKTRHKKGKLFRFESLWLSNGECEKVVGNAWREHAGSDIHSRVSGVASSLACWARVTFGDIQKRIIAAERVLHNLQEQAPDGRIIEQMHQVTNTLDELHRLKESYWHLRARTNELRDGDKNTSYFHHKANQRRKHNTIKGLFSDDGTWLSSREDMEGIITHYFETLFATGNPADFDAATAGIEAKVTEEMNRELLTEPSGEEIRVALFQMHPNKAPGMDGMHALFFQKFWHIVGPDVICFVQRWWRGETDISEANKTCIVLIPKCADPKRMTEFRPISLCNVLYKIVSKTLANKLKQCLGELISINQSAFVPRRLITDNALIAFEIFHYMKRKGDGRDGTVALKLDMTKAYDRVEWSLLEHVMVKFGFAGPWIQKIRNCIQSVSFSFKLNNQVVGQILPGRGLRQGDPISSYLFLLCADAFSMLLIKAEKEISIHGVKICKNAPSISHLFFADDSILFARASLQECSKIADIISLYERASGQKVNLSRRKWLLAKKCLRRGEWRLLIHSGFEQWINMKNIWVYRRLLGGRRKRFLHS